MASIAEILLARGRSEGDARRRQGESSAAMWSNLGNTIGSSLMTYAQQREQQKAAEAQAPIEALKVRKLEAEVGQVEDARTAATRTEQNRQAAADAIAKLKDGKPEEVFAQLQPEVRTLAEEWYQKFTDNKQKRDALRSQDRKERAQMVQKLGYEPTVAEVMFGLDDDPEAAQIFSKLGGDDAALRKIIDAYATAGDEAPNLMQRNPELDLVNPKDGSVVAAGVPKPVMKEVTVRGPNGRPVRKLVSEAELAQGVEQYEAPREAPRPDYEWVTRNGQAVQIQRGTAQAGDVPYRPGVAVDAEMPSEYQTALERSIMSVPAVRRGSVVETANRLWREGNQDELKQIIRQAAVESENVDAKNQIRGRQATLDALTDTKAMLAELKKSGVPTNLIVGTVEDVARKLGKTTNPEYVRLGNRLMDTLIQYRRAATGVQFSQKEQEQYAQMFPNYKSDLPVNLAAIDGLERSVRGNDRTYWVGKLGESGAALVGATPSGANAGAVDSVPSQVPAGVVITRGQ